MDKYHAFELGLAFGRGLMINKKLKFIMPMVIGGKGVICSDEA